MSVTNLPGGRRTLADLLRDKEEVEERAPRNPSPRWGRMMATANRRDVFVTRRPNNLVTLSPFRQRGTILLADVTVDEAIEYLDAMEAVHD